MNATHTPGPWRDSAYTCTERGRSGPTHAIVCDRDNGHNGSIVADYISNPANARLIAAAPAMLAFVERVSNTLRLDGTARNAALVTDAADLLRLARGS